MAISTEKKIKQLEDEIKALKATYSVYGGAMQVYLSQSPVYVAGEYVTNAKIKFTPDYKPKDELLVASLRCDINNNNFLTHYATIAVQDGSGSIIIQLPVPIASGGKFSVSIATTSPGTFTRLQ